MFRHDAASIKTARNRTGDICVRRYQSLSPPPKLDQFSSRKTFPECCRENQVQVYAVLTWLHEHKPGRRHRSIAHSRYRRCCKLNVRQVSRPARRFSVNGQPLRPPIILKLEGLCSGKMTQD